MRGAIENCRNVKLHNDCCKHKHNDSRVNVANGTARDYEDLIESVIEKVKEHSGVTLEREVRILGEHE